MLVPGLFLLFFSAFSTGIHASSQIIADALANEQNSQIFYLANILDEYVGHLFTITLTILMFMVAFLEINRKPQKLSKIDGCILLTIGLLNGFLWGFSGVEAGSMYLLMIPTASVSLIFMFILVKKNKLRLRDYPFAAYSVIASVVMLLFAIWWVANYGLLIQPSDFGLELMSV